MLLKGGNGEAPLQMAGTQAIGSLPVCLREEATSTGAIEPNGGRAAGLCLRCLGDKQSHEVTVYKYVLNDYEMQRRPMIGVGTAVLYFRPRLRRRWATMLTTPRTFWFSSRHSGTAGLPVV